MKYSIQVIKAFNFSFEAHMGKFRKGSEIPYIVHPMDVASVLMKNGASEALVVAGLLHDVVEDAGVKLEEIKKLFGKEVADLVNGASESEEYRDVSPEERRRSWKDRKSSTISKIGGSDTNLKLLSCADKLSNIRDMINDYDVMGESLWDKLNADFKQQAWYYRSMLEAYTKPPNSIGNLSIYKQLEESVHLLFGSS